MVANTNYEVKTAVNIGEREVLIAEDMNEPSGNHYMKAEYSENGIVGQYDKVCYSSDYLVIMDEFVKGIEHQISLLRTDYLKADYQNQLISAEECFSNDYGTDIVGEVVAIKASALRPEYRRGDVQLVFVTHGSGAKSNPSGSSVFCYHLNDGVQTRFDRQDILGVIKELPDWARTQLDTFALERNPVKQPVSEKIGNYTITERVCVGDKQFVLGENMEAVSPFATWQSMKGRDGYDIGHYFSNREEACISLNTRVNREREYISSGKSRRVISRDEAR